MKSNQDLSLWCTTVYMFVEYEGKSKRLVNKCHMIYVGRRTAEWVDTITPTCNYQSS